MGFNIRPADLASWEDLQTVFGTRGMASRCQCQRYGLAPGEALEAVAADELRCRLRDQTREEPTPGLLAFLGRDPVGWCAVAPRPAYPALLRSTSHTAWLDRDEQPGDPSVWSVTCFWTRAGYRREGTATALAAAAVEHARRSGAAAIEAYPRIAADAISVDLHVGPAHMFEAAGLFEVSRPSKRRSVMRLDFPENNSSPARKDPSHGTAADRSSGRAPCGPHGSTPVSPG